MTMNIKSLYKRLQLVLIASLSLMISGCSEMKETLFPNEIAKGDEVMFTTAVASVSKTRSDEDDYNEAMKAYQAVNKAYVFNIEMYEKQELQDKSIGTGTYQPVADDENQTGLLASDENKALYWNNVTTPYAFKATAGSETLSADQSTMQKWLLQDRLEGYGYIQKWDKDNDRPVDELTALNYHSAKEWRSLNKEVKLFDNDEDYKRIPLYLQHQRALITVILKAGDGVSAKALYYSAAKKDIHTTIRSYEGTTPDDIQPLASGYYVDEDSTTRYDAIVVPHDYSQKPTTDLITRISLSGQNYSFYAANDKNFKTDATRYDLMAGQHLVITVTLGRNSREVHMTAYIEDWTEEVTNSICDDYGNAGEPIMIENRQQLIDFLSDPSKNKAGNVALVTKDIDLKDWSTTYDLHCTLNLGGYTLISNYRFLNNMTAAANLLNGTIQIGDKVNAAIATANSGNIEDVKVTTKTDINAYATVAGVVENNTGTISRCRSSLRVMGEGATPFVGGIAATSTSSDSKIATIDACTVYSSVKGGQKGGGIVGQANGVVSNNTFEYGITLLQDKQTHKNIVGEKQTDHSLTAENNAWPTKDEYTGLDNATASEQRYDGIIDSGEELKESAKPAYNIERKRYRLAQDITVSQQVGSITYDLDGNNKQITTEEMIFNAITGKVHDLTVCVSKSLIATPDRKDATDAIAPLAFEVHGEQAAIERVNVKMADDTKIQASNPAGLVVWAYGGATVSGCEAKVNLYADVETQITQGRKFAGGIVSTASWATVTQCIIHSGSTFDGTQSSILYYGGIVGGIEHKEGAGHEAEVTITDCTSFLSTTDMPKEDRRGAIIGNTLLGAGTTIATKNCQGNWWSTDCNGVGTKGTGNTDEMVLGKRNAVTPVEKY